jgi:hypothetical protein
MPHNKEKRLERIDEVSRFTVDDSDARCILFRRCYISDRLIFLRKAVKMRKFITGPGFPLILVCWIDKKELLLLEISGKLDRKSWNPFD